jgi:hypothetical protein
MTRWGFDDVSGVVIGGNELSCALFYDSKQQKCSFLADNDKEAMQIARRIKQKLLDDFGGRPCFLYRDDSKWELRIKN